MNRSKAILKVMKALSKYAYEFCCFSAFLVVSTLLSSSLAFLFGRGCQDVGK